MVTGKIYKITNLDNKKIYIGKTIKTLEQRFQEHIVTAKRWQKEDDLGIAHPYQSRLYPAMNLHGYEKFSISLVEEVTEEEKLELREIYWISKFNSTDDTIGYNISRGGFGGPLFKDHRHSDETKEKIRLNSKQKIHLDSESILARKQPCTNKWQNLQTGDVIYSIDLPKGYVYKQQIISYKVYKAKNLFFICLGQRRNALPACTLEQCWKLQEMLNALIKVRKRSCIEAMQKGLASLTAEQKHQNLISHQKASKQRQKEYWVNFINQHNLNIERYIADYNRYKTCCPNRHLELIYKITYTQVRGLNKFLGLSGGGSGHLNGKVIIEENCS